MAKRRCDGCQTKVKIAGGIGDLWSFSWGPTGGMILELADGSDHFLCLDCVDQLPADKEPTAEDVHALPSEET
ncbi:DUF7561 family protein [Natronocalculus amylovorans]|uniref:Small CPxCG-related zinc finger protein n=1 Tax=Natronocalculus amylovorans TaxID=2917812 RepID=A0AAE3K765_9EURY|nr:hypothetical protein [Natronocalculus amylovorans]MCL9815922.1 hypothetical protein [Natronocalculus amylovorans]NUE01562.1 hypothetical protein [Halorubraceae archaeon YAN]